MSKANVTEQKEYHYPDGIVVRVLRTGSPDSQKNIKSIRLQTPNGHIELFRGKTIHEQHGKN